MKAFDIVVPRGSRGFGLSLIYRGLDKFPEPETGIFVARVVPGGNSHRSGLRENDKILRINKKVPKDVNDAVGIIKKAGKEMILTIGRKGQPDLVNQEEYQVQPEIHQPALSRSGSARSINTQFAAGNSRPQTPHDDSSGDEARHEQFPRHNQQDEEEMAWRQQQMQLEQQRAAMAEEKRRLMQQQQELQQQREQVLRQQQMMERERALQEEQLNNHRREAERNRQIQNSVTDLLARGKYSREVEPDDAMPPPGGRAITDSSDDEDFFSRSRRSRSLDPSRRREAANRAKSPGSWSAKSGISLHDLSELSAVSKLSRKEEKENLQGLNNRLAGYIDKVRQLQKDNARMVRQVEYVEISQRKEIDNIKSVYEREIDELKKAIDGLSRDYRDLQSSSDKLVKTNRDLKSEMNKTMGDIRYKNDTASRLKEELHKLRNRMIALEKEKKRTEDRVEEFEPELLKTKEKLSETLYQTGEMKKVNSDLELQAKKLGEELRNTLNVMEDKLSEIKIKKQIELNEMSGRLEREYEDRVQKALNGLREVYEEQMKENKDEFGKKYESKVRDLQSMLSEERAKNNSSARGLEESEGRINALTNKMRSLENEQNECLKKLANLEKKRRDNSNMHKKQIDDKEKEMKDLLSKISQQMDDYQTLLETKTALDMEIAVYRKLVESEEDRLGLDFRDDNSMSLPSSRASTPGSANRLKNMSTKYSFSTQKAREDYSQTARGLRVSQTHV